ncbi:hypothetical protein D3C81_1339370 [compost metagenome]
MEQKILAVRIVEPLLPDTIGVGEPAPRFVEHKQTVELAQLTALGAEQTRQAGLIGTLVLQSIHQGKQQRIGLFD